MTEFRVSPSNSSGGPDNFITTGAEAGWLRVMDSVITAGSVIDLLDTAGATTGATLTTNSPWSGFGDQGYLGGDLANVPAAVIDEVTFQSGATDPSHTLHFATAGQVGTLYFTCYAEEVDRHTSVTVGGVTKTTPLGTGSLSDPCPPELEFPFEADANGDVVISFAPGPDGNLSSRYFSSLRGVYTAGNTTPTAKPGLPSDILQFEGTPQANLTGLQVFMTAGSAFWGTVIHDNTTGTTDANGRYAAITPTSGAVGDSVLLYFLTADGKGVVVPKTLEDIS